MAFADMYLEIVGTISNLSVFLAQTYVRRAWQDIVRQREWSFLQADAPFTVPTGITAGSVAVTQFSRSAVADATADAALNAVVNGVPPLVGRQFRVANAGPFYTITAYAHGTRTLTLDQPFQGPTNAAAPYLVWQAYCTSPVPGTQRFLSIVDPNNGYAFRRLHVSAATLDRRDPTRSAQGMPFYLVEHDTTTDGTTRYELWPSPIVPQTFECTVQLVDWPLVGLTATLPDIVPESLVVNRALARYAIPWAVANAMRFPALKGANFTLLLKDARENYVIDLQNTKKLDDGRMLKRRIARETSRVGFPIDASWLQVHDPNIFGL